MSQQNVLDQEAGSNQRQTVKLTREQTRRAQRYIDAGLYSSIIANAIGARRRQVARLPRGAQGARGNAKKISSLFKTRHGQIEVSAFLLLYRRVLGERTHEPKMTDDVDIDALIAVHQYLSTAAPEAFFQRLDINSAHTLIQHYLAGEIQFDKCRKRHCLTTYAVHIDPEVANSCPACGHGGAINADSFDDVGATSNNRSKESDVQRHNRPESDADRMIDLDLEMNM